MAKQSSAVVHRGVWLTLAVAVVLAIVLVGFDGTEGVSSLTSGVTGPSSQPDLESTRGGSSLHPASVNTTFDDPGAEQLPSGEEAWPGASSRRGAGDPSDPDHNAARSAPVSRTAARENASLRQNEASAPGDPATVDDEASDDDEEMPPESIAGSVLDQDGAALDGIQVMLARVRLFGKSSAPGGSSAQSSTTSGGGFFEFTDLPPGEYRLTTRAGKDYRDASSLVRTGIYSASLVLSKTQEVIVFGTVSSTEGEPIGGARVAGPGAQAVARSDGSYELTLRGTAADHPTLRFDAQDYRTAFLSPPPARTGAKSRLDAVLTPEDLPVRVTGWMTDLERTPVGGELVRLSSGGRNKHFGTRADASGYFTFESVPSGSGYRLSVLPEGPYLPYERSGLVIGEPAGTTILEIALEPQPFASLEAFVIDGNRAPIPGFAMELRSAENTGWVGRVVTDGSGFFTLGRIPAGEVYFKTRSQPELSASGIQLRAGERRRVQISVDWGDHALIGQVLDERGAPVAGSRLELTWQMDQGGVTSRSRRLVTSDAEGWFGFDRVGPGMHQLSAATSSFRTAQVQHEVGFDPPEIQVHLSR